MYSLHRAHSPPLSSLSCFPALLDGKRACFPYLRHKKWKVNGQERDQRAGGKSSISLRGACVLLTRGNPGVLTIPSGWHQWERKGRREAEAAAVPTAQAKRRKGGRATEGRGGKKASAERAPRGA